MDAVAEPVWKEVACLSPLGFHRMAYQEWGSDTAPRTVVCVHGLTRNAWDFEDLAASLVEAGYRVVCPDVVGRGRSGRLTDPAHYALPQYAADLAVLLARLDLAEVDWVGTSMGGLIGLYLAALPGTPLRRLVLNDIGPFVPKAALERISGYVGADPLFADLDAACAYFSRVHAAFGPLSSAQWRRLTKRSTRSVEGGYRLTYDPAIAIAFNAALGRDIDLWGLWDSVSCPVLALRGIDSDLLRAATCEEMTRRGPVCKAVEFPDCGHAPALIDDRQRATVVDWLVER